MTQGTNNLFEKEKKKIAKFIALLWSLLEKKKKKSEGITNKIQRKEKQSLFHIRVSSYKSL